jgi:SAM-dependent methyltransferase
VNYQAEVRQFYARADIRDAYEQRWGYTNPVAAEYWGMRDVLVFDAVKSTFGARVRQRRALEIGSGFGHELAKLLRIGLRAENLIGIDLIPTRVKRARLNYPELAFYVADATHLPFANDSFDIVMQFTCVMHALGHKIQQEICGEMIRVLRPGGIVIWWDLAPVRWRTLFVRRFLLALTASLPHLRNSCKTTSQEMFSSGRQRATIQNAYSGNFLLTDVRDLELLFHGLDAKIARAGIHFDIWQSLWRPTPNLARFAWRTGWFSSHCFATAQKL